MSISIYDPRVRADAKKYGITELQAYRKLNAAEQIRDRLDAERQLRARGIML